jgi:hypothetical protein
VLGSIKQLRIKKSAVTLIGLAKKKNKSDNRRFLTWGFGIYITPNEHFMF